MRLRPGAVRGGAGGGVGTPGLARASWESVCENLRRKRGTAVKVKEVRQVSDGGARLCNARDEMNPKGAQVDRCRQSARTFNHPFKAFAPGAARNGSRHVLDVLGEGTHHPHKGRRALEGRLKGGRLQSHLGHLADGGDAAQRRQRHRFLPAEPPPDRRSEPANFVLAQECKE